MDRRRARDRARTELTQKRIVLRGLADRPRAQGAYALELIATVRDLGLVTEAAEILTAIADTALRPDIHRVFARLNESPTDRDPGAHTRVALLRALRPIAGPDDRGLLAGACATYEELPTGGGMEEVTHGLRGLGLVMLAETDETLASFHAARLLVDPRTHPMSGEPAATAARVLAAQGHLLPLYGYALGRGQFPEVVAECLRGLTDLPPALLPDVIDRHLGASGGAATGEQDAGSGDEIVLLGLFDLLFSPPHRTTGVRVALDYLRATPRPDLARYLAATLVATRDDAAIQRLTDLAWELDGNPTARLIEDALALR